MNKIEVAVIDHHDKPGSMMMFLAKLTQRGHSISNMQDLLNLYESTAPKASTVEAVAALPHGTIKRFCPITVAIVGASRRFLAQARTHQVGFNYVSASLQYSDYSGKGQFVVPYAILRADNEQNKVVRENVGKGIDSPYPALTKVGEADLNFFRKKYLASCEASMEAYKEIAEATDNDTAGYAAPQGLRNILIIQANHEAWMNFIRLRSCNRNTNETQYVTLRIWEELLKTPDGEEMFRFAGPDCMFGSCREGKMFCGSPMKKLEREARKLGVATPRHIIDTQWPLLKEVTV